jgi:SPP1 family predicted phage head-tail adaptor
MQAGLLKDKITFLKNEPTRDTYGGSFDNWVEAFEKRVYIRFNSGSRKEVNSEVINTEVLTFMIRYTKEVQEKMRIVYEGRKYKISMINRDRIQQATIIQAESINE